MNTAGAHNNSDKSKLKPRSLETIIGLYWLHRLGIVSLVFGIVFLIMSSFQYFAPQMKLLTGFIVSAMLIFLGRKMERKLNSRWFAHGLTAGGWSLAYFSTYAAHYLPAVRVVNSLAVESLLLLAVAGGSLISSLRARSQLMAIYSVTLAASSIILSGPGLLGDVSFLIIALLAAVLGNKMSWRKLFVFGMTACYLGHIFSSGSAISIHDDSMGCVFLAGIWLVFSVGLGYAVHISQNARTFTLIMSCLNAICFVAGLITFSGLGLPELSQTLLAFGGSVYLAASRWLQKRKETELSSVHSILGLSLINVAKVMHFSGQALISLDIMQIILLATIGARFNIRAFRWFAILLTVLLFPLWLSGLPPLATACAFGFKAFPYVKIGFCAAAALSSMALLQLKNSKSLGLPLDYGRFYYMAANLMLSISLAEIADCSWLALALALQALLNLVLAMEFSELAYSVPGYICAYASACILLMHQHWNSTPTGLLVCALYICHAICAHLKKHEFRTGGLRKPGKLHLVIESSTAHAANLMLTCFILKVLPARYISASLGIEGIGLLLVGFLAQSKRFRLSGLAALALLTLKLLFVDFAKFNTIERVISFTVAGVVFLLSSYGYGYFTRSFEDESSEDPTEEDPEWTPESLAKSSQDCSAAQLQKSTVKQDYWSSHNFHYEI